MTSSLLSVGSARAFHAPMVRSIEPGVWTQESSKPLHLGVSIRQTQQTEVDAFTDSTM